VSKYALFKQLHRDNNATYGTGLLYSRVVLAIVELGSAQFVTQQVLHETRPTQRRSWKGQPLIILTLPHFRCFS